jgi:hypothetical protein
MPVEDRKRVILQIGYGSNIADPAELEDPEDGVPVKVHGYRRHVQLPASYRRPAEEIRDEVDDLDEYRGVFNVEETGDDDDFINAVLYRVDPAEAERIAGREEQYDSGRVPTDDIEMYGDDPAAQRLLERADFVDFVISQEREPEQKPNPQYLAEVLAGAKTWDYRMQQAGLEPEDQHRFLEDLLETSEVDDGQTLKQYLQDEQHQDQVMRYIRQPDDVDEWDWETFKEYDQPVTAVRDFFTGGRKERKSAFTDDDRLWEPATDEELVFEAEYMTPENREILLKAIRTEHDDVAPREVFHRMRQAKRASRERREEAEQTAQETDAADEFAATVLAGIRYMPAEDRKAFREEIEQYADAEDAAFWAAVDDAWDRYVAQARTEQAAAADDD